MIRRHLLVHGRVQGVFYRASTAQQASALGVAGWVANRPDGTVEAEVEGPADAVERMIAWCHAGPERAAVTAVDVTEVEPVGDRGFEVR